MSEESGEESPTPCGFPHYKQGQLHGPNTPGWFSNNRVILWSDSFPLLALESFLGYHGDFITQLYSPEWGEQQLHCFIVPPVKNKPGNNICRCGVWCLCQNKSLRHVSCCFQWHWYTIISSQDEGSAPAEAAVSVWKWNSHCSYRQEWTCRDDSLFMLLSHHSLGITEILHLPG